MKTNTDQECTPTQFKCLTGNKCIEGIYRCDGHPDCPDRSDEDCANETITHTSPPTSTPFYPCRLSSSHSMHNFLLSLLLSLYLIVSMEYVGCMCRQTEPGQDGRTRKRGNAILIEKCAATTASACFSNVNATISSTVSMVATSAVAVRAFLPKRKSLEALFVSLRVRGLCLTKGICTPAEWKCASGECLPENERCDGLRNCADGSDESGCGRYRFEFTRVNLIIIVVTECPPGNFRCNDGLCLDSKKRCDGRSHCLDGSDEINCRTVTMCLHLHIIYERRARKLSFVYDSLFESDRAFWMVGQTNELTIAECPVGKRACDNGVCIDERFFCDKSYDCLDHSDERDCHDEATSEKGYPKEDECRADEFACNDGTCIPRVLVCDGQPDCPQSTDEFDCYPHGESRVSRCLSNSQRGLNLSTAERAGASTTPFYLRHVRVSLVDVPDKSSSRERQENVAGIPHGEAYGPETDANAPELPTNLSTPRSCAPDDFLCADGTCIPETHHCDHFYDCRDFTDEQYCFG
ncbi:basement membrane-specific heparan sulfate proteoglycan core protein isoform X1 [Vespula maculifrons]|uniref:Basement membrane-specific heparan sulfate proteoglycan core protein isoform X1 n=1 Tax=Vespula maculifrons TaxID=7453 RepID=A0ABD2C287_VESMC